MPINIEMPKLSDTMTEGTVARWLKKKGDKVEIGDLIAEIETDKATMEMESFEEGVISDILVEEGGKAAVGSAIAVLLEDGEEAGDSAPAEKSEPEPKAEEKTPDSKPAEGQKRPSAMEKPDEAKVSAREPGERVKASPLAKKIAAGEGIDLSTLTGTGPGGRIVKADVVKGEAKAPETAHHSSAEKSSEKPVGPQAKAISATAGEGDSRVELSTIRKIIAERLLTSKLTIPHFYLHVEVDAGPLMKLRKQVNVQTEKTHGNKYTVNDFIVKAMINAAQTVPEVNASFNGDHIIQFAKIGISVAVAVDDGLVTPVVKNAGEKSLLQISQEIKDLATRSRDKKLKPNEFDGGTITISNLGAWGVESFDAIINPPQAAIVSVGGIIEKPVVQEGQIVPGLRMNLGLSCDHRVVDGAVGAKYLGEVKRLIENPALMLI